MTTQQAWKELIMEKRADEVMHCSKSYLYYARSLARRGKYPSEKKMVKDLIAAGWQPTMEREWSKD